MSAATVPKPKLRGWFHEVGFFVSVPAGVGLVAQARDPVGRLTALVYAVSLTAVFGASAAYHRVRWSPAARRRMKRLDHSMIFVLIAGTYTPFALLALHGPLATAILVSVWAGAAAGVLMKLVWIDAPKWLVAATYVILGWVAVAAFPQLATSLGITGMAMVAAGGVLYTAGAVIYALRRPDPVPAVFGYHEVFHVLVILAAALQYAVVAFFVLH